MSLKYSPFTYVGLDRAPLTYDAATNTYSLASGADSANCTQATITLSDGTSYTFPRVGKLESGAKAIWLLSNLYGAYNTGATYQLKAGFMGTFDGQGYVISNLNTQYVDESITFAYTGSNGISKRVGSGLFGIITEGAVIKNFALKNVNLEGAPALATVLNARTSSTSNITFENIYISDEEVNDTGSFYGTFYIVGRYRTPKLTNVVMDLTNITVTTADTFINGTFSSAQNHFTGSTARQSATNVYIVTNDLTKVSTTLAAAGNLNIKVATSMANLYNNVDVTTIGKADGYDKTMAENFANNDYWKVDGTSVYWKRLAPQA